MKIDKDKYVEEIIEYFKIDLSKETGNSRRFDIAVREAKARIEKTGCTFRCGPTTGTNAGGFIAQINYPKNKVAISSDIFLVKNEASASIILKYIQGSR